MQFKIAMNGAGGYVQQIEFVTTQGVARASFNIDRAGLLEISASSESGNPFGGHAIECHQPGFHRNNYYTYPGSRIYSHATVITATPVCCFSTPWSKVIRALPVGWPWWFPCLGLDYWLIGWVIGWPGCVGGFAGQSVSFWAVCWHIPILQYTCRGRRRIFKRAGGQACWVWFYWAQPPVWSARISGSGWLMDQGSDQADKQ